MTETTERPTGIDLDTGEVFELLPTSGTALLPPVDSRGELLRPLPFTMPGEYGDWFQLTTELEAQPCYEFPVYPVGTVEYHSTYKNGRLRGHCFCTFVDAAGQHVRAFWVSAMPS